MKQLWPSFPEGLKVLLIDGNKEERGESSRALKQFKYEVIACEKVMDGIELLRTSSANFHIVIVEGNGASDCPALNLLEQRCGIPVVVATKERQDPKYLMKAVRLGAVDFFHKPLPLPRLKTLWQHVVRNPPIHLRNKVVKGSNEVAPKKVKLNNESQSKGSLDDTSASDNNLWPADRHKRFADIVEKLGPQASPVKILQAMGTSAKGLNKHIVADYLKAYLAKNNTSKTEKPATTSASGGSSQTMFAKDSDTAKSLQGNCVEKTHHQRPLLPLPAGLYCPSRVGGYGMAHGGLTVIGTPLISPHQHTVNGIPCGIPIGHGNLTPSTSNHVFHYETVQDTAVPVSSGPNVNLSEDLVSQAISEALSNPKMPLPIGLKLPSLQGIVAELKKQGFNVDASGNKKSSSKRSGKDVARQEGILVAQ